MLTKELEELVFFLVQASFLVLLTFLRSIGSVCGDLAQSSADFSLLERVFQREVRVGNLDDLGCTVLLQNIRII